MIQPELSRETNGYGFKIKGVHQRGTVLPRFLHWVIVTGLSGGQMKGFDMKGTVQAIVTNYTNCNSKNPLAKSLCFHTLSADNR